MPQLARRHIPRGGLRCISPTHHEAAIYTPTLCAAPVHLQIRHQVGSHGHDPDIVDHQRHHGDQAIHHGDELGQVPEGFRTRTTLLEGKCPRRTPGPAKGDTDGPAIGPVPRHLQGGDSSHEGEIGHLRLHQHCRDRSRQQLRPALHRVRIRTAIGAAAKHSPCRGATGEAHAQNSPSTPGSPETHAITSQQAASPTTRRVSNSQVHAASYGRCGGARTSGSTTLQSSSPSATGLGRGQQRSAGTTADTSFIFYINSHWPGQSTAPTIHDPWNDFSKQRADPIVELLTPALALARSSSPPRVHHIEPQLGARPRVVDPSILQAPQYPSTSYSVWDDTWHTPHRHHSLATAASDTIVAAGTHPPPTGTGSAVATAASSQKGGNGAAARYPFGL